MINFSFSLGTFFFLVLFHTYLLFRFRWELFFWQEHALVPRRWSNGQRARLKLKRSELKSHWSIYNFIASSICNRIRGNVSPIFMQLTFVTLPFWKVWRLFIVPTKMTIWRCQNGISSKYYILHFLQTLLKKICIWVNATSRWKNVTSFKMMNVKEFFVGLRHLSKAVFTRETLCSIPGRVIK